MKPGGVLLLRDYAQGDLAERRFAPSAKIEEHYYVRGDGTLTHFFGVEQMAEEMRAAGMQVESNALVEKVHPDYLRIPLQPPAGVRVQS